MIPTLQMSKTESSKEKGLPLFVCHLECYLLMALSLSFL